MIPKKIERKVENDNYRALALYIADAKIGKTIGEKTLFAWVEGCAIDNYLGAMIEVEATQAMNTTTEMEKTYHLMVSFRPEDEARLTPEIFREIEMELAKSLGFEEHQRHCGVHKNTDNIHMHMAYNMIHPQKFTRHAPYFDFAKLHKTCRILEQKYGLTVDKGIEPNAKQDEAKIPTNVKAQTVEAQSGQESFNSYVVRQKPKIMAALEEAKTWEDFHQALLKIGIKLELRGAGMTMKDRHGKHGAVPSKIDRTLAKATLEEKFGPFWAASPELLRTVKSEERYTAVPLHQNPDRDNLYEAFQAEMVQRRSELEHIKTEESETFQAIRQKWSERRSITQKYQMLYAHRQKLLLEMKIKEQEEIMANRVNLAEKRQRIREAIPYTSWNKYLQHKAALGNEVALAILRSKKVEIEPETVDKPEAKPQKTYDEITLESLNRRKEILNMAGATSMHKKALLSVEKMRETVEKGALFGNGGISLKNYRIDTKGVLIFTFDNGNTIRDTGKEIHFTPNDEKIRRLALQFSQQKWGSRFVEKNDIMVFEGSIKRNDISR